MTSIAIIGSGLAGLTCATHLKDQADVTLFEKARGVSGRMSTRRASPYAFDHGAQFFTCQTDRFETFLQPLMSAGVVARWDARFAEIRDGHITKTRIWEAGHPHYVGAPGMNAIGKYIATRLDVKLSTHITALTHETSGWMLMDEEGAAHGPYDWVISAIPAAQAADLVPNDMTGYEHITTPHMKACYALMLGFETPLILPFDAAHVAGHDISWISVNSAKPGREGPFTLQVHSTNAYADAHIDHDREEVKHHLLAETSKAIGHDVSAAPHRVLHGWRYANVEKQSGPAYLLDTDRRIGVIGDWLVEGRVEAAFISGDELATALMAELTSG